MAVMLGTAAAAPGCLAPEVNVLVARGPVDPELAAGSRARCEPQDGAETRRAPGMMAQGTAVVADIAFGINGDHRV